MRRHEPACVAAAEGGTMLAEPRLLRTINLIVERDVPGRTRDGTTLYADIYGPPPGVPSR